MAYLLGIDQGTSGTKALVVDAEGAVCGYAYRAVDRLYPRPDWVEQDPRSVARGVAEAPAEAISRAGIHPRELTAAGLTCQRNTIFAWQTASGDATPIGNAITWQDMRTVQLLPELAVWEASQGERDMVRRRLGYGPGPYVAALHLRWRLENDPELRAAAHQGDLRLGLSAAWLLAALGRPSGHRMDRSLVQATGLYDFRADAYWSEWLEWLGVPLDALPEPAPTLDEYGVLEIGDAQGRTASVPVLAMIGDQQAALYGHDCRRLGHAACTHGTASYVKLFLDRQMPDTPEVDQLFAWDTGAGQTYLLEASTTVTGAVVRWLREDLGFFDDYARLEQLTRAAGDAGGLLFVPALTGLNAPYYDPGVRGTLLGLTLGHTPGHMMFAFMEGVAFQVRDILETIYAGAGVEVRQLLVGGGLSASTLANQIQADLLGIPVRRPSFSETTAWAAALLAGLGAGVWRGEESLPPLPGDYTIFEPQYERATRDAAFARWRRGVALARQWGAQQHNS